MKLTENDKVLLRSWNFSESDIAQIEEATGKTVYTLDGRRISAKRAIELLGREAYLSGISRSAFHFSSVRLTCEGDEIFFDSSRLFR